MDKTARDHMQNAIRRLQEPTKFERYIVGALHDIHRRVFEEGWFGKTVHDVVSYYNYNQRGDKAPEGSKEKEQSETGQEHQHDYSPESFYGQKQEKEQSEARQYDDDWGMER